MCYGAQEENPAHFCFAIGFTTHEQDKYFEALIIIIGGLFLCASVVERDC